MEQNQKLRRWELALLLGLGFAALLGSWLGGTQSALADRVIRLHVIANSDSDADQALKLQVRDRLLETADGLVQSGQTKEEARQALLGHLPALASAAASAVGEAGYAYPVTASLDQDVWFPTRHYRDFALPAGRYTALRVVIGSGEGKNWWCVAFPPLCPGPVTEQQDDRLLQEVFAPGQIGLITEENEGYVLKFKAVELWQQLCRRLGG